MMSKTETVSCVKDYLNQAIPLSLQVLWQICLDLLKINDLIYIYLQSNCQLPFPWFRNENTYLLMNLPALKWNPFK